MVVEYCGEKTLYNLVIKSDSSWTVTLEVFLNRNSLSLNSNGL